jgi:hypothetical protein
MTYDFYTSTLVVGAAGLAVMALGGLGHHSGGSHHAGGHHVGDHHMADGHHAAQHHGGDQGGHSAQHTHTHTSDSGHDGFRAAASQTLWALASPRVLFSMLLGFGTSGLLFRSVLPEPLLAITAVLGAVLFERAIVSPLWSATLRFASAPAATLESSVTDTATAVTSFDANGQGIVALEVDGQVVQVLGTLQTVDRELGVNVRAGERLRIEAVDAARNCCTVSRQ